MEVQSFMFNISSENPDRLLEFYRDVVALPPNPAMGPYVLMAANTPIIISEHSEVKGDAKEPQRGIFNFFVNDLAAEQSRMEGLGATFIRTAGKAVWGGLISTFVDPDGNYGQLVEFKPE